MKCYDFIKKNSSQKKTYRIINGLMLFVCRLLFIYDQKFILCESQRIKCGKFCQLARAETTAETAAATEAEAATATAAATATKTSHSTCQMPITRTSVDRIIMDASAILK